MSKRLEVKNLETKVRTYYGNVEGIVRAIRAFFEFALAFLETFMNAEMVKNLAKTSLMGKVFADVALDGNEIKVPSYNEFVKNLISFIKTHSWDNKEQAEMWIAAAVKEDNRFEANSISRDKDVFTKDGHEVNIELFCDTDTDEYGNHEWTSLFLTISTEGQYRTIIKTFDITPKERNKALEAFKKCVKNAGNSRSVMFGSYCHIEAFDPEEYQSHVEE